jgi:Protein of unknown function (DUF3105)
MSKKLQEKQDRRAAEQRRREAQRRAARRGNLMTFGVATLVVLVVVVLIARDKSAGEAPVGGDAGAAGCTGIQTHDVEGHTHVPAGTTVDYKTNPPTSGDHYDTPADPGFYPGEVAPETLVHNLEHGQIVIWYRPNAPDDVIDDIKRLVDQEPIATVAAPWRELAQPYNLALSAWGASESCAGVSQDVVDDFRARFQGRGREQTGVPTFQPDSN